MNRSSRSLLLVAGAAATVAALWFSSETQRYRLALGRERQLLEVARGQLSELEAARRELNAQLAAAALEKDRLEIALKVALDESRALAAAVESSREQAELQRAEAERSRRSAALRSMPESVRQTLVAVTDCLRADGYTGLRFVFGRELEGRELRGVELIEHDPETLRSVLYVAGRLTLELDRASACLTLQLFDGLRASAGVSERLPAEGLPLRFTAVDGPYWERRLGHLCTVVGEYPVEVTEQAATVLDPRLVREWSERINDLLASGAGRLTYRLQRLRGVEDGGFLGVLLCGYGAGKMLELSVEAEKLQLEVDRASDTVALLLRDGTLRKKGGSNRISSTGYRIQLPGVTVEQAMKLMLGLITERE